MHRLLALGLSAFLATGSAQAATVTFEATVSGVSGSAGLLTELGIAPGGTLTVAITFDNDFSSGAGSSGPGGSDGISVASTLTSAYSSLSLIAPTGTINAVASTGSPGRGILTQDATAGASFVDIFAVRAFSGDSGNPSGYNDFFLASNDVLSTWDRADPITADILNAMTNDSFFFSKALGSGGFGSISSNTITWTDRTTDDNNPPPVPLPGGLPLALSGAAMFWVVRPRR